MYAYRNKSSFIRSKGICGSVLASRIIPEPRTQATLEEVQVAWV